MTNPSEIRSGTIDYYHDDGLGSITSLTSTSATIAASFGYDAFGNLSTSSGSLTNPFRYTAREFDPESGLYYYRPRYYFPAEGRFVSEDPARFKGDLNFYQYARNNPVLFTDSLGLWINLHRPLGPDERYNPTVVCDGHGGLRVWIPPYSYPPERMMCVGACMMQHEGLHIRQVLAFNLKICAGSPDGTALNFSSAREHNISETAAWQLQLQCLRDRERNFTCSNCTPYIRESINQGVHQLRWYRGLWNYDKDH